MMEQLLILAFSLFLVVKGATIATKYAGLLAESFRLSRYAVGFIVVAVISILPETLITINSAAKGVPDFALGMLFGSNVADMTLIFALIVFFAGRGIKVESGMLRHNAIYPFILLLPLVLGLDGQYSRAEGATLVIAGFIFYYLSLRNGIDTSVVVKGEGDRIKNATALLLGMAVLLLGAHFTVTSSTSLAGILGIDPVLIGMLIVGIGTTMPELFFSLKAVRRESDDLAMGDILGTVLADATVVVGILALLSPFSFPPRIVYVTGTFMVVAAFMLFGFLRSGKVLSKRESRTLLALWVTFVFVECIASGAAS